MCRYTLPLFVHLSIAFGCAAGPAEAQENNGLPNSSSRTIEQSIVPIPALQNLIADCRTKMALLDLDALLGSQAGRAANARIDRSGSSRGIFDLYAMFIPELEELRRSSHSQPRESARQMILFMSTDIDVATIDRRGKGAVETQLNAVIWSGLALPMAPRLDAIRPFLCAVRENRSTVEGAITRAILTQLLTEEGGQEFLRSAIVSRGSALDSEHECIWDYLYSTVPASDLHLVAEPLARKVLGSSSEAYRSAMQCVQGLAKFATRPPADPASDKQAVGDALRACECLLAKKEWWLRAFAAEHIKADARLRTDRIKELLSNDKSGWMAPRYQELVKDEQEAEAIEKEALGVVIQQ